MDLELIVDAFPQLISGIDETLILAGASLVVGFGLAVLIALMQMSRSAVLEVFATGFVYVFRSTPLLVQIFLIYYGSGQFRAELQSLGLWVLFREAWFCAIFALTLNTGAYTSQIVRGGLQSVPVGQIEAARAMGMSRLTAFRRIIFPIVIRQALPGYSNEIILMIKSTSLASTITIIEITAIAKKIIANTFQPIEVFLIAGAIYLLINFAVTRVLLLAEYHLSPHLRDAKTTNTPAKAAALRASGD
jgi:octopine/nopaline transport system permease protein